MIGEGVGKGVSMGVSVTGTVGSGAVGVGAADGSATGDDIVGEDVATGGRSMGGKVAQVGVTVGVAVEIVMEEEGMSVGGAGERRCPRSGHHNKMVSNIRTIMSKGR